MLRLLSPRINFTIHVDFFDDKKIVIFEIQPATGRPVRFKNTEYIRIGSLTKKLHDFPEKEKSLWKIFDKTTFEDGLAKKEITSDEVLSLIDYPKYFSMLKQSLPDNRNAILQRLLSEKIILPSSTNQYNITNVGAILFADEAIREDVKKYPDDFQYERASRFGVTAPAICLALKRLKLTRKKH